MRWPSDGTDGATGAGGGAGASAGGARGVGGHFAARPEEVTVLAGHKSEVLPLLSRGGCHAATRC